MIIIKHCKEVDIEHSKYLRSYAHTFHKKGVICVAGAWRDLPIDHKMGIIAHEIGHLLMGNTDHSESEANKAANKFFDIHIQHIDSKYGKHLQCVSLDDTMNIWEWVYKNVKLD